jgi:hypothetical protein
VTYEKEHVYIAFISIKTDTPKEKLHLNVPLPSLLDRTLTVSQKKKRKALHMV